MDKLIDFKGICVSEKVENKRHSEKKIYVKIVLATKIPERHYLMSTQTIYADDERAVQRKFCIC